MKPKYEAWRALGSSNASLLIRGAEIHVVKVRELLGFRALEDKLIYLGVRPPEVVFASDDGLARELNKLSSETFGLTYLDTIPELPNDFDDLPVDSERRKRLLEKFYELEGDSVP